MGLCLYASTSTHPQCASSKFHYTYNAPLELHASTPPCHHTRNAPPDLLSSTFASTRLRRTSSYPYLHTPTSAHLQRASKPLASRPPDLHVTAAVALLHISRAQYLLETTHLHRTSRTPYIYTSTFARLQHASSAPCLHTSMPPRLCARSVRPCRRASRTSYLHIYKPTAHPPKLHISVISQVPCGFGWSSNNCETLRRFFYAPYRLFLSLINRNCCCI